MTASLPTGRRGQALAFGLALVVLATIWIAAVQPILEFYANRAASLTQRTTLVRRMADLSESLPSLRARLANPGALGQNRGAALQGSSDAVAGADLQQRVQAMAAAVGVTLTSTETLPSAPAGDYRRIGLHMSATATWPVLVDLLRSIREATPRMLVDDLQVSGPRMMASPAEPPLEVAFTVYGFRSATATPQ